LFGETSFGETLFGETSFGETSFGEMSFGEMSFEETLFGETSFGECALGGPTLYRFFKVSSRMCNFLKLKTGNFVPPRSARKLFRRRGRVTRWVCKKIAQNVAQKPFFVELFPTEKSIPKKDAHFCNFQKSTQKQTIAQ
jgi:hypothetical protein